MGSYFSVVNEVKWMVSPFVNYFTWSIRRYKSRQHQQLTRHTFPTTTRIDRSIIMSNNSSTGGRSHPRRSSFIPPLPRPPSSIAPAFLSMPSLIAPTRLHIAAPRLMAPRQQSVLQGPAVTSSASSQQSTNQLGNLRKWVKFPSTFDDQISWALLILKDASNN